MGRNLRPVALGVALALAGPGAAQIAGDGATLRGRIAFSRGEDIWTSNLDGGGARRLTRGAGPEDDPSWAPDGSRLAYRDSRRGYNVADEIYVINADGSERRNLSRTRGNDWGPAWSPDGKLIAFNSSYELHVIRPDGSGMRRVTAAAGEYPAWSPDGKRLAFMCPGQGGRRTDPNYDICVVNLNGSRLKRITSWKGEDGWPAWSPDGRWIAYSTTQDDEGQFEGVGPYKTIYVMRPDGSAKRRVVRRIWASTPAWSPDSRLILFNGSSLKRFDEERLWIARRDGSGLRRLSVSGVSADWLGLPKKR
jgi:TolB protein